MQNNPFRLLDTSLRTKKKKLGIGQSLCLISLVESPVTLKPCSLHSRAGAHESNLFSCSSLNYRQLWHSFLSNNLLSGPTGSARQGKIVWRWFLLVSMPPSYTEKEHIFYCHLLSSPFFLLECRIKAQATTAILWSWCENIKQQSN